MLILALTRKGQENYNGSVPDDVIDSGICGDPEVSSGQNVTWKLTGDGVLTISGTGAMANYNSTNQPWAAFKSGITTVVIGNGVTTIGNEAFADCMSLATVTVCSGSVTELGDNAFEGCNEDLIIYVPMDEYDNYCNRWPAYAAIIQPIGAIPYIAADGTKAFCTEFTELTGNETSLGMDDEEKWYVVNNIDGITYDHTLTLTGDVHIILADGCTMNVGTSGSRINGIGINSLYEEDVPKSLTIYGQSRQTGNLNIYSTSNAFADWGIFKYIIYIP